MNAAGVVSILRRKISPGARGGNASAYPIRALVVRAVLWSLAFGAAHLFGVRAYTSMLSGTVVPEKTHIILGTAYILLYLGFVFLVPTLLIAAGILKGVSLARALRAR